MSNGYSQLAARDVASAPPAAGPALFEWVAARNIRAVLALVLLSLALLLPGINRVPPVDRDEPRFAQASKQMLETGDLVDIRFQDEARHKKPVGIYWLQAATVHLGEAIGVPDARRTIALYRIPSLLGAVLAVVLTWWAALPLVGRRAALVAGAVMAACILLGVEARLAKTDAVLLAAILACQGALARIYLAARAGRQERALTAAVFWVGFAAGTLIKGPMPLMFAGLTVAALSAFDREWRWIKGLRFAWGLPLALLVVLPWFVMIGIQSGGAFFQESVGKDLIAKVGSGQEKHWAPPLTYFGVVWGTFFPGSILLIPAAVALWYRRNEPFSRFLIAWIVPAWLIFEAVPTKLPHYVLPLFPVLAIAVGSFVVRPTVRLHGLMVALGVFLILLGGVALPAAITAGLVVLEHGQPIAMGAAALAAAAVAVFGAVQLARRRYAGALAFSGVAAAIVWISAFTVGLPSLRTVWPSVRLAEATRAAGCPDPAVTTAGYREPSLVFLTRTDLGMTDGAGAAEFLKAGGCRMAFVEKRVEQPFLDGTAALSPAPRMVTRVRAFNFNGGRWLDIGVYAVGTP